MIRTLIAVLAALAFASGCGAGDESTATSGTVGDRIEIVATDFAFEPETVNVSEPGEYTFRLANRGGTAHALHVEGGSVSEATEEVAPGKSTEIRLTLQAGTYRLVCPVGNHADRGMTGTLDVGSTGGAGDDGAGGGYDY